MKKSKLNKLLELLMQSDAVEPLDSVSYITEDNPVAPPSNIEDFEASNAPQNASLDQAVDRYIVRYEKEAIPTSDTYSNELYENNKSKYYYVVSEALNVIKEQDAPTPAPQPNANNNAQPQQQAQTTDDQNDDDSTPSLSTPTPQINLQDFARNIARLVNNYESLIKPKDIILNRIREYIKVNYDVRTSNEFMDILSNNYNLKTYDRNEQEEENTPTTYLAGALSTEG